MDLLYQKYADPFSLIRLYIENGRFCEFVDEFLRLEQKRKKEEAEKEETNKLWAAYIHSGSEDSFDTWKVRVGASKPQEKDTRKGILKNKRVQRLLNRLKGT